MADMVTNTVGIMLFILIFVSLSAGGAVVSRHLPRERSTKAKAVWLFCSHGEIVPFDAAVLAEQLEKPLGVPSFYSASQWARNYSARRLETDQLEIAGDAKVEYDNDSGQAGATIVRNMLVRHRPNQRDDAAVKTPGPDFQTLLAERNKETEFLFFFVTPDSIPLFRAARDRATQAGFGVGWSPLGADEPARITLSGGGREATIQ